MIRRPQTSTLFPYTPLFRSSPPLPPSRRVRPRDPRDARGRAVDLGPRGADREEARVSGGDAGALRVPATPGAPRAGRGAPRPRDEPPELRSGPDQLPRAVPGVRPAVPHPRRRRRLRDAPPVAGLWAAGRGRAPPLGTTLARSPPPTCPPHVADRRAPVLLFGERRAHGADGERLHGDARGAE